MDVNESVLNTIKKCLDIDPNNKDFDTDILLHINSVLTIMKRLGIIPKTSKRISDDSVTWSQFIPDDSLDVEDIKDYIFLRVKLIFDPPQNQKHTDVLIDTYKEIEFGLMTQNEIKDGGEEDGDQS